MKKEAWLFGAIALLFAFIGMFFAMRQNSETSTAVDNLANPAALLFSQSLPDLTGKAQPLSQWQGKTLVVNFWASWCAPCVKEMPELSELQRQIQGQGVQIIGIGIDSQEKIREFASKYPVSYPLYVSGMEGIELGRQMGNTKGGLPFTLLLDSHGTVKKTYLGQLDMSELRKDLGLH
jgi:thiol-disulfide isomerase/thioredoxin